MNTIPTSLTEKAYSSLSKLCFSPFSWFWYTLGKLSSSLPPKSPKVGDGLVLPLVLGELERGGFLHIFIKSGVERQYSYTKDHSQLEKPSHRFRKRSKLT